jgi:hypothetical protein
MARRRRYVIAYQEIAAVNERLFLSATSGQLVPRIIPHAHWWCAADKPEIQQTDRDRFAIRPVYNRSPVPEDARCETCAIGIRELQQLLEGSERLTRPA